MSAASEFAVPFVDLQSDPPEAIADALIDASCAFIVNHGVPAGLRTELVEVSKEFFAQPREAKAPTQWDGEGLWKGWQPVYEGTAEMTGDREPDPLERFEIQLAGHLASDDQSLASLRDSFAMWPDTPARFADVWTRYYCAMGTLASTVTTRIAEALDLPAEDLPAWTDEHHANLVVINYLAQYTPQVADQQRLRTHTDRGGLTLLWADQSPGGLEVMRPETREWVSVQIPEDAFLVQVGDLMTRWTNRVIRPNIHRVTNAPAGTTVDRISIPYFHYPRLDSVVTPAPSCLGSSERPAPPSVVAGEHVFSRQEAYKDADLDGVVDVLATV